jgi:hypothetical protein
MVVERFEVYLVSLLRRLGRLDAKTCGEVLMVLQKLFAR